MNRVTVTPKVSGQVLADLMKENDIALDLPCGGNHICGKCKVKVLGDLSPLTSAESHFLDSDEIEEGIRLACFAKAFGPVEIILHKEGTANILTAASVDESLELDPMMDNGFYGVAIDIGTTTVVASLFNGQGRKPLAVVAEMNRQRQYGSDVISRIGYCNKNGVEPLRDIIRKQLEDFLMDLADQAKISRNQISHSVITGNTTMMHIVAGLDPASIGAAPFTPMSLFGQLVPGILDGVETYITPCVSGYVGGDLVCCILASSIMGTEETAIVVDIGTNGEMCLLRDGKLNSCSTAAGPAFEGAGIHDGMAAKAGAINKITYNEAKGQLDWKTIDEEPAQGICGSGLVDGMAALLEGNCLKANGRIKPDGHGLEKFVSEENGERYVSLPNTDVGIYQEDIRQVQMAKGAIHAGMYTLMEKAGITATDVTVMYLCGGFGSYLNLKGSERMGLIPEGTREKTIVLNNGALAGAISVLLNKSNITKVEEIAKACEYVELSGDDFFMGQYVRSMRFQV